MKYLFVTGGVSSSLGKGLTCASLGLLLERRGLRVRIQKFDPYINVDAGTMNPYQHGEVYVTEDGAETDLDLGHYHRFTDNCSVDQTCNVTAGRIYQQVIAKERRGDFLGQTVQVIPHITNEIKHAFEASSFDVDIVLNEIGGTVGDIEGLPFFEAARQFALEKGSADCAFLHLTLIPYLGAAGELKTKPTQHSVALLRQIGIQPDMIGCRCEHPIDDSIRDKIALFCSVKREYVVDLPDVDTPYALPVRLSLEGFESLVMKRLGMTGTDLRLDDWKESVNRIRDLRPPKVNSGKHSAASIAVVGKYVKHADAYKSIYESLTHASVFLNKPINVVKIDAEDVLLGGSTAVSLVGMDGILVPGGFGVRGIDGKLMAIKVSRERKIPFFGICLGMQCAVIEFARNVVGITDANSAEFTGLCDSSVIALMDEQARITDSGGTMRLGSQNCRIIGGNLKKAHATFSNFNERVYERHRHRYEFNNRWQREFEARGLLVTAVSGDGLRIEAVEWADHPWSVGVQYHPEFRSKFLKPHPLFCGFVQAASERANRWL